MICLSLSFTFSIEIFFRGGLKTTKFLGRTVSINRALLHLTFLDGKLIYKYIYFISTLIVTGYFDFLLFTLCHD